MCCAPKYTFINKSHWRSNKFGSSEKGLVNTQGNNGAQLTFGGQEILRCFHCLLSPKGYCFLWCPACHVITISLWLSEFTDCLNPRLAERGYISSNETHKYYHSFCVGDKIRHDIRLLKSFNYRNIVLKNIYFFRILIFKNILFFDME